MSIEQQKVECAICGYKHHILQPHLAKKHDMTPLEYMQQYDQPWFSEYGRQKMMERDNLRPKLSRTKRTRTETPLLDVFPEWAQPGQDCGDTIEVFTDTTAMTPTLDTAYVFPMEQTLEILTVVSKPRRNNIWIAGGTGTGKSELVRNLAAKVNASLYQTNFDAFQTRGKLFGSMRIRPDGSMYFEYGILPRAMMEGAWLCIHELDTGDPGLVNILKPMLEDNSMLVIDENGGEVIKAHPDFRVFATNNTWSRGDESGQFVNTEIQSAADLRRWNCFVELNYLEPDVEMEVIQKQVPALLSERETVEKFIDVANATRSQYKDGQIDRVLSTAEVINWCENYVLFASPHRAARVSFLRSYEPEVANAVLEHINNNFGQEDQVVLR